MKIDFDREEGNPQMSEINMTPLVDVMLVLLVIFLITAPLLNSSIKLNLPKDQGSSIQEKNPITISINKEGEYFLEQQNFSRKALEEHLKLISQDNPEAQIHLRIDLSTEFRMVSDLLSMAQKNGLKNIGFITEPR